jgi:hypothetical protein
LHFINGGISLEISISIRDTEIAYENVEKWAILELDFPDGPSFAQFQPWLIPCLISGVGFIYNTIR